MLFYFMPMREICSQNIKEAILPLWNPYIFCGNPLLANMQSAVFYPLTIFYYVFPFDIALRIGTYLTFFIMSIFFYFYLRLNNISEEGSVFSSLIFSYNYYMLIKAVELADINVLMWLPAILYFAKKYLLQKKIYDLFFLIFTLSLSFLGGHLQVFFYVYLLLLLLFFYEIFYSQDKNFSFIMKITTFVTLILLFIVSIQLLPTIKFILNSSRNVLGLDLSENISTYLKLEQILLFFFPFLIKIFSAKANFYNWVSLINISVTGLLIFFIGIQTIKNIKFKNYWLIILTFVLFICIAGNLPFYEFIFKYFKPLKYVRYVVKINIILLFIICFFAAYGFDNIFNINENNYKKYKKFLFIFLWIFIFLLVILIFLTYFKTPILKFYKDTFNPIISFEKIYDMVISYNYFLNYFLNYLLYFFISIFILYLIIIKKMINIYVKNILILLIFLYLFNFFNEQNNSYINYNEIKETDIISIIKNTPNISNKRILSPGIINPFDKIFLFENDAQFINYYIETLYPNVPTLFKIRNVDGFDSLFIGNFHKFKSLMSISETPWENPFFKLFSTKYIIAKKDLKGKNIILKDKNISYLYEHKNSSDIAFFIPFNKNILFLDYNNKNYKKFFENIKNPFDNLIFDVKDKNYIEKLEMNKKFKIGNNKITSILQKNINEYEIFIKNENDGFLILTDNYYPGWEAYINGKKVKLLNVFLTFKCVFLKKGLNNVKFIFNDNSLTAGIFLSILVFLFILIFIFYRNKMGII